MGNIIGKQNSICESCHQKFKTVKASNKCPKCYHKQVSEWWDQNVKEIR